MNLREHLDKHPELMDQAILAKLQSELPSNEKIPANYDKLNELANLCHIPGQFRNDYKLTRDLINRLMVRIVWGLEAGAKDLKPGTKVLVDDKHPDEVVSIAKDYSVRLKTRKGSFNPKHLTVI